MGLEIVKTIQGTELSFCKAGWMCHALSMAVNTGIVSVLSLGGSLKCINELMCFSRE
jgi:hypothetical protein